MAARAARVWVTLLVVVSVLIAAAVIADFVVRGIAERQIAAAVEERLPEGVTGEVTAQVRGVSAIGQLLSGTADEIVLTAPSLQVNGVPIAVEVVGRGVPIDLATPVERIEARIDVSEASVNGLVRVQGIPDGFTFADGTVGYGGSVEFLGLEVGYSAVAEPEAAGDRVLLRPVSVEVATNLGSVDASAIVDRLTGGEPLPICVAEYLPLGVEVVGVTPSPGEVRVDLEATGLLLDENTLATRGACG